MGYDDDDSCCYHCGGRGYVFPLIFSWLVARCGKRRNGNRQSKTIAESFRSWCSRG